MRCLKIAFLSRWYGEEHRRYGSPIDLHAGGPTRQLAEAVAALGHEVVVLSQSPNVTSLKKSQIGALETWLSPREQRRDDWTGLRDKWAKRTYGHRKVHSDALDLRDFLAARGPFDVLWAQCEEPDGLVAGMAAAQGFPVPPTLTQIYALRYRFRNGVPVFTDHPALRLAFGQAARLAANSRQTAQSLEAYAAPAPGRSQLQAKVCVVGHNLQSEFLKAAAAADGPLPEPGRVLFFGALNEKKGALVFAEAISRTRAAGVGAVFVLAGGSTGKDEAFARQWETALECVRRDLAPAQLEMLGKISPTEAIRQIRRASVVVLPSLFDEYSRALVEALVLGRPVVTTNQVGAATLVEEQACGRVVAPNDPEALAAAIDDVLQTESPYLANAGRFGPRLRHEVSAQAIALRIVSHLSAIALPAA